MFACAAAVAALALAGGIAYAAIPDPTGMIHCCFKTVGGQLRVIDTSTTNCLPSETAISWNQIGAQGTPGVSGYEEKTHQVFVSVGAFANVSVSCSAGKKVLGGGFDIETPDRRCSRQNRVTATATSLTTAGTSGSTTRVPLGPGRSP
jgi:hypothetical protein